MQRSKFIKVINNIAPKESLTQNRVVKLFSNHLHYSYLGNWKEREDSGNILKTLGSK